MSGYKDIKKFRRRTKERLVKGMGGCCQICGYNKSLSALEFHHINPNQKDFTISSMKIMNWEKIKNEAKKCILVCANCHREIHDNITELPIVNNDYDFEGYDPIKSNQIVCWDEIDLQKELNELGSYKKISDKFGTTVETVRKKCKEKNIKSNKIGRGHKKINMSDHEFLKLLENYSQNEISEMYGISKVSLWRRNKKINARFV
jgi:hypothetical protein